MVIYERSFKAALERKIEKKSGLNRIRTHDDLCDSSVVLSTDNCELASHLGPAGAVSHKVPITYWAGTRRAHSFDYSEIDSIHVLLVTFLPSGAE